MNNPNPKTEVGSINALLDEDDSGSDSTTARQSQTSAAPVLSKNGDSSDPGKVSKPNNPKAFSIPEKEYTLEEVAKHNKKDDLWIAVKGVVLDLTNWVDEHPVSLSHLAICTTKF